MRFRSRASHLWASKRLAMYVQGASTRPTISISTDAGDSECGRVDSDAGAVVIPRASVWELCCRAAEMSE